MPRVFRRRAEFVVAEEAPAGGTVTTRNGILPVAMGDMLVHTSGDSQHYSAADFAQQFEAVGYDDAPENLREIVDPERAQKEREAAEKKEEREEHRTASRSTAGKTTKSRSRSTESRRRENQRSQERKAAREKEQAEQQQADRQRAQAAAQPHTFQNDEHHDPAQTALQDRGDFGPQPTPEAQRNWGE